MQFLKPILILGGIFLMSITNVGAAVPEAEYLSGLLDRVTLCKQGWGELGIDVSAHEKNFWPAALRVNDKTYTVGLGTHANGEMIFDLGGDYDLFEAEVGVQWQDGDPSHGSVVFQVFVDGKLEFDSGVMRQTDSAKPVSVPVKGAKELRLITGDADGDISFDVADWADARLSRSAGSSKRAETMDIAPFATVSTWDPARMTGSRADRLQEFHADDLFLGTQLVADKAGDYSAPSYAGNLNCIGLEWMERRRVRLIGLQLADATALPLDKIQVQAWAGESKWQGGWQPAMGIIEQQGDELTIRLNQVGNAFLQPGTDKLRWILPGDGTPIKVRKLWADTTSRPVSVDLALTLSKPHNTTIETYNGYLDDGATKRTWDGKGTLPLSVRSCDTGWSKLDRTVLRIRLPESTVAVALDDVIANDCVYVPGHGVFVAKGSSDITLNSYLTSIAGRKTILEQVREMPDQTMEQAMAKTRNPIQDTGPTMLSLACDNHKFIVEREGVIRTLALATSVTDGAVGFLPIRELLAPRFGSGRNEGFSRRLDGEWMPAPVNSVRENGLVYTQRTFVVPFGSKSFPEPSRWLNDKPLCVAEFTVENTGGQQADASLQLTYASGAASDQPPTVGQVADGVAVTSGERLVTWTDLSGAKPLSARIDGSSLLLTGTLSPGQQAKCIAYMPAWEALPEERDRLTDPAGLFARFQDYWNKALAPSMQIELPDKLLERLIKASQVHCMLAARSEENGERVSPWISALYYGPLESEANSIVEGMSLLGQDEFTRRSLDYFIYRYKPEGYLTTGYTLMGSGWHLWSVGDYFGLYGDTPWLNENSAKINSLCQWIVAQTKKTEKLDARGQKVPEYGLVPPGVYADWNSFFYGFGLNGYYYKGLDEAAKALAAVGTPNAKVLKKAADDLRGNILRAYEYMRDITPVVPLKDGTWVKAYPSRLFVPGPVADFFPGEDANRSWCYDVEAGSHQMVPHGILEPNSPAVDEMMDNMEDVQFLGSGWFDYPAEKNEQDWFNFGGFSKVQPYYTRNGEIYALRDDVKPFVRSYLNSVAAMISAENLAFWEHFRACGAYNKTHETGYFMQQSRFMLVMERGEELWLAPLITSNWLKDGMVVAATNAPTSFGPVSYRITSHVAKGFIEASIDPPTRQAPKKIVIRLRHPEGKQIRSVMVNGRKHTSFDPAKETISVKPDGKPLTVRAEF